MPQRVMLVINSLGMGGAERVLANLVAARACAPRSLEIHLVLLDDLAQMRNIEPVEFVHVLNGRGGFLRSALQLRALVDRVKPDVVVSFLIRANCAAILATAGRDIRCVLSERMHTTSHLKQQFSSRASFWLARTSIRLFYPRADKIIAVSKGVAAELVSAYGISPSLIKTIPNPFDLEDIRNAGATAPSLKLPEDFCVCLGRLVPAKNMESVIEAFAAVRPTKALVIVGNGAEDQRLRNLATSLGVCADVIFAGFVDDPFAVIARARFYVSASRNEGFPNAAAEAMALGIPVILTDCPSGPRELLGNGRYGCLVPQDDPSALQQALRMLSDQATRAKLGALAAERMEEFALEVIARRYWNVICGVDDDAIPSQRSER